MNSLQVEDIKAILTALAARMAANRGLLIELDSIIGDGDLGLTMSKGFAAMAENAGNIAGTDIGTLLIKSGMVMAKVAPSTMGTLIATGFMKGGKAIQGKAEIGVAEMAAMMEAFVRGISDRGKAKPGEKTIIDSLLPAVQALQEAAASGVNLSEALRMADEAACNGLENTKQFVSQHGKAAVFREKTLGKQDPGATVGMLMMKTFAEYRG